MNSRERFLAAAHGKPVDKTPIWVMRQAGRYLPEYRALKEKYSFIELAQTPELAAEVTLQPLKRFDLDGAVIFSDILVIPEAMGQPYHFRDQGGIGMDYKIETAEQIENLSVEAVEEKLQYVAEALKLVKGELAGETALLGFGGSPWTLACYMVEGGSSEHFLGIKSLCYENPALFESLMTKVTAALIRYFKMQIAAGADIIQIFDSWGAACSGLNYWNQSLRWIEQIISALSDQIPFVLYAKGMGSQMENLVKTGAQVISLDHTVSLAAVKESFPHVSLQGNLDPALMSGDRAVVEQEATKILQSMSGKTGHIFNLGHGILPSAKIENMEALVNTVHGFKLS